MSSLSKKTFSSVGNFPGTEFLIYASPAETVRPFCILFIGP